MSGSGQLCGRTRFGVDNRSGPAAVFTVQIDTEENPYQDKNDVDRDESHVAQMKQSGADEDRQCGHAVTEANK